MMNKSIKYLALGLSAFIIGMSVNNYAISNVPSKIAVVDVQKVVASSAQVKALKADREAKIKDLTTFVSNARAAVKKETAFDRFLTVISSIGMAIPSFFFAILMLIFAVKTGWFPVGGLTSYNFNELGFWGKFTDIARHLILPSIVLFTISLSGLQRQMRANMLEVLDSDYVKFARAKGLSEWRVLFKHALRNAINPMITLLGFEFAGLLSGAALTEYVFQYPGLGRLILEAVMKSDINLVMASLMMGTIMLILGNLIADILLMITDPRLRKGEE